MLKDIPCIKLQTTFQKCGTGIVSIFDMLVKCARWYYNTNGRDSEQNRNVGSVYRV